MQATAIANPNIAFIKYWGNCDPKSRLPANGSISMNLGGLYSRIKVIFSSSLVEDELFMNGVPEAGAALNRVKQHLDRVRQVSGVHLYAHVEGENNFPMGTGIASSASAFAALSLAATHALGLELDLVALSRLARQGSGSACRSVPGGFVEWLVGESDLDSYAVSLAPPEHWGLVDCIAVISREHKTTGSTEGHNLAYTSPLQEARIADAPRRLDICRKAILKRDFGSLAEVAELDSNMMHAVMITSSPRLMYWKPATLAVMEAVQEWRNSGIPVFYTIDAGPNVHVITLENVADDIESNLQGIYGVLEVMRATVGGPVRLIK